MKLLYRFLFVLIFIGIFVLVVGYAKGYRFDLNKKPLMTSTGILAISSYPQAAKIYINGQLKGITDTSITVPPGNYQIDIKKDGYTSLTKNVILKGELVVTIDALLFPLNPTLSPLTNLGVIKASPIDDTEKMIIFVDKGSDDLSDEKNGIYLFESGKKPLPFFPPLNTIILKKNIPQKVDFKSAKTTVSPDLKEAIIEFGDKSTNKVVYLLSLESENTTPFDVTASYDKLITAWTEKKLSNNLKILETFPPEFAKVASQSVEIINFSPSETKLLYRVLTPETLPEIITPPLVTANQGKESRNLIKGNVYVYDKKEDKNYLITAGTEPISNDQILWYFDSKHLLVNQGKKIVVLGYDGDNSQTIYSGPYESSFFMSTLDGKIVVLSNLNPEANLFPDLYLVGTR